MNGRRFLAGAAIPWLVLLGTCATPPEDEAVEFRVPVRLETVETGTVEDRIVATGTLRAVETVVLRTDTAGTLRIARRSDGRRLSEGDRVEAGQRIAEVTGEEVRLAARSEATRQRYESARREYESQKRLYDQGLISEQELRNAETALADAKMDAEQSRLTEDRSQLVTPISGVVLELSRDDQGRPLAEGQLVSRGQTVARIAPTRRLVADVDLVGSDLARVEPGLPARVRHHAWDDRVFEGRVTRLAPELDPATRTLRCEVEVLNPDRILRPGMFVEVIMVADRREGVPVVPRDAITERGEAKVVFVAEGQRVRQREVRTGLGDDDVVEILGGVQPGERVVVRGLETLTDGTRVRVSGS